ncbi:MAG: hypothetical protein V1747_01500 [Candidatus Omnitrophota bacterium]
MKKKILISIILIIGFVCIFSYDAISKMVEDEIDLSGNTTKDELNSSNSSEPNVVAVSSDDTSLSGTKKAEAPTTLTPIETATSIAVGMIASGTTDKSVVMATLVSYGYEVTEAEIAYAKASTSDMLESPTADTDPSEQGVKSEAIGTTINSQSSYTANQSKTNPDAIVDSKSAVVPDTDSQQTKSKDEEEQRPVGKFKTGENYEPRTILGLFKMIILASKNGYSKEQISGLIQKFLNGEDVVINTSSGTVTITTNLSRDNTSDTEQSTTRSETSKSGNADPVSTPAAATQQENGSQDEEQTATQSETSKSGNAAIELQPSAQQSQQVQTGKNVQVTTETTATTTATETATNETVTDPEAIVPTIDPKTRVQQMLVKPNMKFRNTSQVTQAETDTVNEMLDEGYTIEQIAEGFAANGYSSESTAAVFKEAGVSSTDAYKALSSIAIEDAEAKFDQDQGVIRPTSKFTANYQANQDKEKQEAKQEAIKSTIDDLEAAGYDVQEVLDEAVQDLKDAGMSAQETKDFLIAKVADGTVKPQAKFYSQNNQMTSYGDGEVALATAMLKAGYSSSEVTSAFETGNYPNETESYIFGHGSYSYTSADSQVIVSTAEKNISDQAAANLTPASPDTSNNNTQQDILRRNTQAIPI